MKPDFALSLSFEGIDLLVRAAGGWRMAGHVDLETSDLSAALTQLRQRAIDLGGPAFRSKLIIPADQIRYLSVDTGHVSAADRMAHVRAALDGATPYAVEELVYDICVDGALTHVAAVARDTLKEAETFALEHRFHPVSFAAIPGNEAFLGEPFFGPTQFAETALAAGERVEPDGIAVVIVGDVEDTGDDDTAPERTGIASGTTDQPGSTSAPIEPLADIDTTPLPAAPPQEAPPPSDPVPGFSSRRVSAFPDGSKPAPTTSQSTIAPQIDIDDPADIEAQPPQSSSTGIARDMTPDTGEGSSSLASWFLSRRGGKRTETPQAGQRAEPVLAPPPPAPTPRAPEPGTIAAFATPKPAITPQAAPEPPFDMPNERDRMTIFGMRNTGGAGKAPKYLGLILTAILLMFLAIVALWASLFLDAPLTSRMDRGEERVAAETSEDAEWVITESPVARVPVSPSLSDTDAAVLDVLRNQPEPREAPTVPDQDTAEARYAVTGIWQKAPEAPVDPGLISLDDLYLTSIDPAVDARDAVALPGRQRYETDEPLSPIISPGPPGSQFAFDDAGRVIPTPEGAISPDGFTVILGRPPVVPPAPPQRGASTLDVSDVEGSTLVRLRPQIRPSDLIEQTERAQLGGLTLSELSGVRPLLRPEVEKSQQERDETPTAQAVLASLTPAQRPADMASLVERAVRQAGEVADQPTLVSAAPATVAPAIATPRIPSSASVARAATVDNAINLRRVNLIGVYGTPSNRRALVRMPNGRYRKVEVGDRLDGGRISAIGDSELRYQKNGRNLTLSIPSG